MVDLVVLGIVIACFGDVTCWAATPKEWMARSIYQIVTDRFARSDNSTYSPCDPGEGVYCGGTFRGIINRLDYIQDLGFSAIWISPVTYQFQGPTKDLSAYHGYWQQDLYRINPNFGSPEDLEELSTALHTRGMYLMVDVVVNDFAWPGNYTTIDYSQFVPFNYSQYFHRFRLLSDDPQNETCVLECWLGDEVVSLADLRTEDAAVASAVYLWAKELVANYSIDGLRLDSIFNVDQGFWQGFNNAVGVYCLGEGSTDQPSTLCPLQSSISGLLDYSMYYRLTGTFNNTNVSMDNIIDGMENVRSVCKDPFALGVFSENQDVPRFASYTDDLSLASNILVYTLLGDGIPIVYYGQEQHLAGAYNPINREALWLTGYENNTTPLPFLVQSLNRLRSHAATTGLRYTESSVPARDRDYLTSTTIAIYNTSHTLALRKGHPGNQVITILSNLGSHPNTGVMNSETQLTLSPIATGFHQDQNITEIISCDFILLDDTGDLQVSLHDGGPRVYYPTRSLEGAGVCGFAKERSKSMSEGSALSGPYTDGLCWLVGLCVVMGFIW